MKITNAHTNLRFSRNRPYLLGMLLREYIKNLLIEEIESEENYLYHVTTIGRLPSIAENGLGGGSAQFSNYSSYSAGRNFLTDHNGVGFWHSRVEAHSEHNLEGEDQLFGVPVILRINAAELAEDKMKDDEVGNRDAKTAQNFIFGDIIPPEYIDVFDGSEYYELASMAGWSVEDFLSEFSELYSIDREEDEETGEEIVYVQYNDVGGY